MQGFARYCHRTTSKSKPWLAFLKIQGDYKERLNVVHLVSHCYEKYENILNIVWPNPLYGMKYDTQLVMDKGLIHVLSSIIALIKFVDRSLVLTVQCFKRYIWVYAQNATFRCVPYADW